MPVQGKVTFDGKPLPGVAVAFLPDTSKGNNTKLRPLGRTDPEGNYSLKTEMGDGAPLGWYKVTVSSGPPTGAEKVAANIPGKYEFENQTDLRVEVVAAPATGAYDLTLKGKAH